MNKNTPHEIDLTVGKKIRLARALRGVSQEALAEKLGISFQQIQKYEKAKNRVSASRLYEIAKVLECPITYFFEEPEKYEEMIWDKQLLKLVKIYLEASPDNRENLLKIVSTFKKNFKI